MILAGWFITWILLITLFIPVGWRAFPTAEAAEWKVEPGISWRGTYDDNILFEDAADYESRLKPGLEIRRRTERSQINLSGVVDIIRYLENSRYNRDNQDYRLQAQYATSPRMSLNLSSRARIDNTFDEFFEEDGLVTDQTKRYTYDLSPGMSFALDGQSSLDFNIFSSWTDYEQDVNPDSQSFGASLAWSRAIWDGRTELLALTGGQQVTYDIGPNSESEQRIYRFMLGVKHRFSPTLDATVRIGPLWTESRFEQPFFKITEEDLTYVLDGSLNWRLERSRLGLDLSRTETQSTYGENIIRDRFSGRWTYDVSPLWRATIRGSYIQSRTEGIIQERENEAVSIHTSMSYALSPTMDLSLGYNYRRSEDKIDRDTETGNRVYVQYSVRFPQKW